MQGGDDVDESRGGRDRRRVLAGVAGVVGVATMAWAGSGFAAVGGAVPSGQDALVAGAAVCYGLVLLGASWAGRRGRDVLVLATLLGLGGALFLAGPVGLGLLAPVNWSVLVATVSVIVGLPAIVLAVVEAELDAGQRGPAGS